MTKVRIFILSLVMGLVLFSALTYLKPNIVANSLGKFGLYEQSAKLYEFSYSRNNNPNTLESLSLAYYDAQDYKQSVFYFGKLIKDQEYLKTYSDPSLIEAYYLDSLFNDGQKDLFRESYNNFYLHGADKIFLFEEITDTICKSRFSKATDYEFGAKEGEKLLSDPKESFPNNNKLGVYNSLELLYSKQNDMVSLNRIKEASKNLIKQTQQTTN